MPSSGCQTCARSEEHTSELQSHSHLVCRLLLEKNKKYAVPRSYGLVGAEYHVTRAWTLSARLADLVCSPPLPPPLFYPGVSPLFFFFKGGAPPETHPLPPPRPLSL